MTAVADLSGTRGWRNHVSTVMGLAALMIATSCGVVRADFNYPDFTSVAGLTLNGNASQAGSVLRLTPNLEGQAGTVWRTAAKAHVADGFDTTFTFRMVGNGADGMAFVIQDDSATALGSGGSGLGFEGIPRSIAIEIDSFGFFPETDNHVSVQTRGATDNSGEDIYSLAQYNVFQDLNDGNTHSMTIRYRPGFLLVFLDGSIAPIINIPLDLADLNGDNILDGSGDAWVGFSGGTGGVSQTHEVNNWNFDETGDALPGGACCTATGCVASDARNCGAAIGGHYAGDGSDCETAICEGACCDDTGCSWFVTIQSCAEVSGTFMGVGTECPNFTCMGACCTPTGDCVLASKEICINFEQGVFHGAGSSCVPFPCPLPALGGCCDNTNECLMKTQAQCALDEGTWFGQGTSCLNANCFDDPPVFGACCQPGGTCVEGVAQLACEHFNGEYNGNGSLCANSQCSEFCNCQGATLLSSFAFFDDSTTGVPTCLGTDCNLAASNSPAKMYSFTPAVGGQALINTCNGADFDTIISVHSGCPMTSLNLVACDQTGCGELGAQVFFCVEEGQTYYVRVGGVGGASGDFTLFFFEIGAGIQEGPFQNPANGHWYYRTASGTWTANEEIAVSKGGHLVTINDAAENAWVASTFPTGGGVMIGLNDTAVEGTFAWANGQPVTYTNWEGGQPDNGGGNEDYGLMRANGLWIDQVNCPVHNGGEAVIEVNSVILPGILAGPIANPANCSTYYLTQPGTWIETQLKAQAMGGNLVTINNAAENEFVRANFVIDLPPAWIGLRDTVTEGTYFWADGTPFAYNNWIPGEPNNINNEDYVAMADGSTGGWNDAPGGGPFSGVIEVPGSCILGDMNCSGTLTLADVPIFIAVLLGGPGAPGCPSTNADMNGDTLINGRDIRLFTDAITP